MSGLDWWLFRWINAWVARSPAAFYQALDWSSRVPWLLATMTLTGLWFVGEEGVVPTQEGRLTRMEAQRRVLMIIAALVGGFLAARVVQALVDRVRPLAIAPMQVPIPPAVWDQIRAGLSTQGAFPSDHAVMMFVVATGVLTFHRRWGILALAVAAYLSLLRVGVGFHWPSDILGGAVIGIGSTLLAIRLIPWLRRLLDPILLQFRARPALMYALGFLFLWDLSQKFAGLFGLITWLSGYAVAH